MRRLPRILLLLLLTGPALLATVALLYLWPRGHRTWDELSYRRAHGTISLQSTRGHLVFLRSRTSDPDPSPPGWHWKHYDPYDVESFRRGLHARPHPAHTWTGITWHSAPEDPPPPPPRSFSQLVVRHPELQVLILPIWAALIPAALPLLFWLLPMRRHLVRRRRARLGHCLTCGYDLRGTPDACPECGTASSPPNPAARPLPDR